jgi:LytS/YehU family sensor histidine kinase
MHTTLMTARGSLPVCVALFLVGGWGLGRDIGFEVSLLRERRRADTLAREAEHAQLLAIRSHLDPHFLFNTLNAIAEWCREDGEVAERAVLQLSAILRAVLAGVRAPAWPLASELGLVRDLFALHLLRDPALFTLEWDVPSPLPDVSVLPMILLPLAENAIKHGPGGGHRGVLRCTVVAEGERLRVTIENPGAYGGPRAGSEGLPTVGRRLQLAYAGAASVRIAGCAGTGGERRTRVELEVPAAGPGREVIV